MVIKLIMISVWLGLIPLIVGCLWDEKLGSHQGNIVAAYICGLFSLFALFEIIAIPMIFMKQSLTRLVQVWMLLSLLLTAASVIRNKTFPMQRRWLRGLRKKMTALLLAALCCMLLQAGYVTIMEHQDADDAFYLATATTSEQTDTLYKYNAYTGKLYKKLPSRYVFAAWPLLIASVSRLTGFHPVVLAHMILPAFVVLWVYMVYALFAAWIFPGDQKKQGMFLLLTAVLLSFSGYSRFSAATFALIRGWQGKAVLAGVGIPAICWCLWMIRKDRSGNVNGYCALLFCMTASACLFSTMGVALSLVLNGCAALVTAFQEKNVRVLVKIGAASLPAFLCGFGYLLI